MRSALPSVAGEREATIRDNRIRAAPSAVGAIIGWAPQLAVLMALSLPSSEAKAWAEHEHVEIGRSALAALTADNAPEKQRDAYTTLQGIWTRIRANDPRLEQVLCPSLGTAYGRCVGFPGLPMLAGDHSCTPSELDRHIAESWILDVIDVAHRTELEVTALETEALSAEERIAQRQEIRRDLDIDLQSADPEYLSRASGNQGHFSITRACLEQPLREFVSASVDPYAESSCEPDGGGRTEGPVPTLQAPIRANATAMYLHYHAWAITYASDARRVGKRHDSYDHLTWKSLLAEAYALHFLQDSFSAGHIVGAAENDAVRMGTHDYYCRHGIATRTWAHEDGFVQYGDAFLHVSDRDRAAAAMKKSLEQLATALTVPVAAPPSQVVLELDTCSASPLPLGLAELSTWGEAEEVIELFPKPASDQPGPPEFRNEFGAFVPLHLYPSGGPQFYFGDDRATAAWDGQIRGGLGVGFASDGALGDHKDGLIYVSAISALTRNLDDDTAYGFGFRVRLPFAYFPGDAVVWAPMAAAGAPLGFQLAQKAVQGGRTIFGIPLVLWASGPIRVMFDLGREVEFLWQRGVTNECELGGEPTHGCQYSQWDATFPLVTANVARNGSGKFGQDVMIRLSGRLGNRSNRPVLVTDEREVLPEYRLRGAFFGAVLSIDTMNRFYFE